MIAPARLYLDSSRRRVVREGDSAAAYLLCFKGEELSPEVEKLVKQFASVGTEIIPDATAGNKPADAKLKKKK